LDWPTEFKCDCLDVSNVHQKHSKKDELTVGILLGLRVGLEGEQTMRRMQFLYNRQRNKREHTLSVGLLVGVAVGLGLGFFVGSFTGLLVGVAVGLGLGFFVGSCD
jgi:hypothetical protein